jgi:hypothetical protein
VPATPTITITQPTDEPPRLRITINNGASVIIANYIWRATSTENDGVPQLIANTVADDGMFDDFNVASGLTYSYYVIADDGSSTAQSLTSASSITLHNAVLHAVTKNSSTANAIASTSGWQYLQLESGEYLELEGGGFLELDGSDGGYGMSGLAFYDQSHSRQFRTDSTVRVLNNASGPRIGLSTIEQGSISVPSIIPNRNGEIRDVLRTAYLSRAMLCLRTALGDKWFGRISSFKEQPSGINFLFNMTFEILDFSESVA